MFLRPVRLGDSLEIPPVACTVSICHGGRWWRHYGELTVHVVLAVLGQYFLEDVVIKKSKNIIFSIIWCINSRTKSIFIKKYRGRSSGESDKNEFTIIIISYYFLCLFKNKTDIYQEHRERSSVKVLTYYEPRLRGAWKCHMQIYFCLPDINKAVTILSKLVKINISSYCHTEDALNGAM